MIISNTRHDKRLSFSSLSLHSLFCLLFFLTSCTSEITVELPTAPRQLVVEGRIATGTPPVVAISWSQGYFETIGMESLGALYRGGAEVWIEVQATGSPDEPEVRPLLEVCTSDIPPEALPELAAVLGVPVELLLTMELCFYTALDWIGETGHTYTLHAVLDEAEVRAATRLHAPVPLDEVWFEVEHDEITGTITDSLGFLHATLTDPDTLGNAYRWGAQRLNLSPEGSPFAGQPLDSEILYPLGSVTDDRMFNGVTFEFWYYRADSPENADMDSTSSTGSHNLTGYFKVGDTVSVEWSHIDLGVFRAIDSYELQLASQANPFASPADLKSNVEGGLGIWAGYSTTYDTVICTR